MTRHSIRYLLMGITAWHLLAGSAWAAPAAVPSPTPLPSSTPIISPTSIPGPGGTTIAPYIPNTTPLTIPQAPSLPPPPYIPADVPQRPLTAEEACLVALRHQPNVDIAAANVIVAEGKTQQVKAALYTTTTYTANYEPYDTDLGTVGVSNNGKGGGVNVSPGLSMTLTARQLLYDFQHTRDEVRQAVAQEKFAQYTLTQTEADLVLTVKQNFYTYVEDNRLIDVNLENIKDLQEHFRQTVGLYQAGTGLPSDVVQAQAAVAAAIETYIGAVNTAETARVTLAASMGIDPRTPIVASPSREGVFDDSDVTSLIDLALQVRPEVKEAQATIEADQYGLAAAHTTNAPSISANTTASQIQVANIHQNEFTASVELDWTPLDGGVTQGLIKQAKGNLQIAQDQLRLARNGVITTVSTAYLNLRNALQQVATDQITVANAKESLRLQTGRYAAGIGLALDVLDAEQALVAALASQVNDETAVDNARASLIHAMGTPPASFGAPLGPTDPLITGKGPIATPMVAPTSNQPQPFQAPNYHPIPTTPAPSTPPPPPNHTKSTSAPSLGTSQEGPAR